MIISVKFRKRAMMLFLIVMIPFVMTSCDKEKVELTFRITWDEFSGRGEAIQTIIEKYNESQNNIHVTMISGDEDKDTSLQLLKDGEVDVFVMPYRFIQDRSISDYCTPLNDKFELEIANYYPSVVTMAMEKDTLMGIPWIGHSMALVYNKDLIKEAGIDMTSWDDLDDLEEGCRLIKETTGVAGIGLVGADHHDLSWMSTQFIYSFGGSLVELDENGDYVDVTINEDKAKAGLSYYIDTLGKYAQDGWENDTGVEVMEAFGDGEVALEIQGPWAISDIWKRGDPFEVGAIPLSQINMYSEVGPLMLVVSKGAAHQEEAEDFIKYMISEDSLDMIMNGEYIPKYDAYYPFRVPISKDMINSKFFNRYTEFVPFIEGFEMPSISSPSKEWVSIQDDIYVQELHEVIIGNQTLEACLEKVEEAIRNNH